MGEYARYRGQDIKIGTCESMYYLRADQKAQISGYQWDGSERFRFPFPDEDSIQPGQFEDYDRGVRIPGWELPAEFGGHGSVQFRAEPGYLLSVPCPEGADSIEGMPAKVSDITEALHFHRNGWSGGPVVRQQKFYEGNLVTVVSCASCGALWRLETLADAEPVAVAFRAEADRSEYRRDLDGLGFYHGETQRAFLNAMADRILAGYVSSRVSVEA